MTILEFLSYFLTVLTVGQLIRYLQTRESQTTPSTGFPLKYLLYSVVMVVVIGGGTRLLGLEGDNHFMVVSAINLVLFAFLFWRTKVLSSAQKV